ncbi:hypothetical protein PISMIDRAFT_684482 [Pisolithus microcarpus 441]|uniref:Uncharacterized protein n=1 Tax=Pisolithus microcarpus 441 TaxID=765257 RepID=A0A0C9YN80_9AGAM|nr:hypothetical protein PISMIDRAFT_684482 [Pisolithus microcarpus 441]
MYREIGEVSMAPDQRGLPIFLKRPMQGMNIWLFSRFGYEDGEMSKEHNITSQSPRTLLDADQPLDNVFVQCNSGKLH